MHKPLTLSMLLLLTACVKAPHTVTIPPAACANLVPADWREGVEATPIPTPAPVKLGDPLTAAMAAQIVAPWASAYVGMSGQLDKANGRTRDAMAIVAGCETMVNAARPK